MWGHIDPHTNQPACPPARGDDHYPEDAEPFELVTHPLDPLNWGDENRTQWWYRERARIYAELDRQGPCTQCGRHGRKNHFLGLLDGRTVPVCRYDSDGNDLLATLSRPCLRSGCGGTARPLAGSYEVDPASYLMTVLKCDTCKSRSSLWRTKKMTDASPIGYSAPDGALDRMCRTGCGGMQRLRDDTVEDAGDGHLHGVVECENDKCGARDRVWWWEKNPRKQGLVDEPPQNSSPQDAPDSSGGKDTDPSTSSPGTTGPVSTLSAERDGVPLDVQLLQPVPAAAGASTEYQEVPSMAEVTGLSTAITYAQGMSKSHGQAVTDAETFSAGLQANGVTGEAVAMAARVMEQEQVVAQMWGELAAELGKQTNVQEAYLANPDAGDKNFVMNE